MQDGTGTSTRIARHLRFQVDPEARVLGGRYRVRRMIGRGGVGDVYLGEDLLLGRDVAIKILHQDLAEDVSCLDRFRREALILAAVRSPHVVGVYDIGVANECVYLVMQHVEGQTIEEIVGLGPITASRAQTILGQVLEGLAAMHARGLVHRDLQPSNVLVDRAGDVVLLDLGILFDTRPPAVAAPTVSDSSGAEHPSSAVELTTDVYQIGLLMIFLMTGVDFPRRSQRLPLERLVQRLPPPLVDLARCAVHHDPALRFASAIPMLEAFRLALDLTVRESYGTQPTAAALADETRAPISRYMSTPLIAQNARRQQRILLVAEDPQFRTMVQRMLASSYQVFVANDVADARDQVEAGARFCAILCGLPDPYSLFWALNALVPDQAESIVFLTSSTNSDTDRAFLDSVANKRLARPLESVALRKVVDEQIARHPRPATNR